MVALGWLFDVGLTLAERWSIVSIFNFKCWLLAGHAFDVGPMLAERWSIVSIITDKFWLLVGYSTFMAINVGSMLVHRFKFY